MDIDELLDRAAPPPPPGAVDVDGLLARAAPPPPRDVSATESLGMGALKGATFGTAPAIAKAGGALSSMFPVGMRQWLAKKVGGVDVPAEVIAAGDANPEAYRDVYRKGEAEAQHANPALFTAGEVAGGLASPVPIPGSGLVRGATSFGAKAGARALQGAAGGAMFGGGEAIGEGASAGEVLERAGAGAAGGAVLAPVIGAAGDVVTGAASKLLQRRAEKRMVDQAIKDIAGSKETGLSKPTDRRQIAKMIEPIKDELRDPEAIKIADTARKDPGKAWEMVQKKVDAVGSERAASYAAVDAETGGFHIGEFRHHLAQEVKRLGSEPGQVTERQAIEAMIDDIEKTWGGKAAPTLPTVKLRQYVTRLQRVAADTMGGLEETRRVQILDHVSGLAKGFLDQHLDAAAKADPALAPVVSGLREQNRRVAAWLSLEDALKTRASKLETNNMVDSKPKMLAGGLAAAGAAAHFLHSPAAAAVAGAAGLAPYVVPPIDRAVTRGLARMTPATSINPAAAARLIQAARAGASRPALHAQADRDGVPVEIADNIAQQSGR